MQKNLLEQVLTSLGATMETPPAFGVFHIISIITVLGISFLAVVYRKKLTERTVDRLIMITGIVMVVLEIYKQLVITYDPLTDIWAYKWYIFPFQFCSTPIYITWAALITSRLGFTWVSYALKSFLATYSVIGGLIVLFIPNNVFCPTIGVNIQTMVHHGLMVSLGVALLASETVKPDFKTLRYSFFVFMPLVGIAMIMNAVFGNGAEFDMFYLAPDSTFMMGTIRDILGGFLPYSLYLAGYVALFTLGAALVIFVTSKVKAKK